MPFPIRLAGTPAPTPSQALERYPPQVKYIVGNEACERFSFYGMASILVLYMHEHLHLSQPDATRYYHLFFMATYLTPLVGGWIADRFAGRFATILWISLAYVIGHGVLAAWETRTGLLVGLALIAVGAGGIKPCVSAFVGDQLHPEQRTLIQRIYGWFYWIINFGSGSAKLLVPFLLDAYGPRFAFALPGVLMVIALLVFWAGRRHYVRAPPSGPDPHSFLRVVAHGVERLGTGRPGEHWLDLAREHHPAAAVDGARSVLRLLGVFAAVTVFWALFDQKGSSWVFQARQMDLSFFGEQINPAQVQALNPFMVMALIPLFAWVVFPLLERRGVILAPLRKMTAGMFITVLSFVAAAVVQIFIDAGAAPQVLWQVPQYLLLTAGEVLVSVTGLEFAYTQAPRPMRSTIMSLWFLTVFLGNGLTALLARPFMPEHPTAPFFWAFAGLMLLAAFGFRFVAGRYRPAAAPAI